MSAAIPECIDVSSVTPDSVKSPTPPNVVLPEAGASQNRPDAAPGDGDSASSGTVPATTDDRASSPPPSCPICLGTYKNKCFTDSCLHQFCFNCLLEWSKIKAECPLCKQNFKSIIHNVKSEREFEEYQVQQPMHYNLMLNEPFRFSYSTTLHVRPSQNEALQRLILHHSSLTDRYIYSSRNIDSISASSPAAPRPNVRRRIYERGLYALPLFDITGRARECSAEFYRNNRAQAHRLIPFMHREANHVIQDHRRVTALMSQAMDLLSMHDITSTEFRREVEPYFREYTVHFIHEFYNFARSPYDIYGYDNNVQYSQDYNLAMQATEETGGGHNNGNNSSRNVLPGSSTSVTSSSWPYVVNRPQTNNNNLVVNVISSSSSSSSGSDNEAPSTSSVSVIQTNPAIASTSTQQNNLTATGAPQIKTELQQRVESVIRTAGEPSVKIELSDTDSDECQFVLERKPPHLRTPEYVSLNSDEDSDVVFVQQSTEAPVMPSREPVGRSQNLHQNSHQNQPLNLSGNNLLEDSRHMPQFMPYMYGMDVLPEHSLSNTSGGHQLSNNGMGGLAAAVSAALAEGTAMDDVPLSLMKQQMKYEDQAVAGPSRKNTSQSRRKRRRQQRLKSRQEQKKKRERKGVGSSSESDIEVEKDEETVSPPTGRKRRAVCQQLPKYATSSSSSSSSPSSSSSTSSSSVSTDSSHDEYRISPTKGRNSNSNSVRNGKRSRRKASRNQSQQQKLLVTSPVGGVKKAKRCESAGMEGGGVGGVSNNSCNINYDNDKEEDKEDENDEADEEEEINVRDLDEEDGSRGETTTSSGGGSISQMLTQIPIELQQSNSLPPPPHHWDNNFSNGSTDQSKDDDRLRSPAVSFRGSEDEDESLDMEEM